MENQNNNSKLKAIIAILAFLLVGSLVYIFKMTSDAKSMQTVLTETKSEKESVLKDLSDLKTTYDAAIAENTSMSDELIAERDKVVKLISDLKKSKGDVNSLSKYKQQYIALDQKMKNLMQEVEVLKKENQTLTTNLDSTKVVLEDSKNYNQVLVGQNDELVKTVEKGSKLTITNLKTSSFKLRSSGKEVATDKASRTDILKINFTVAENKIAKSGDKVYYVQVIDSKNNVLGDKATITFGETILTYSFTTTVKYDNQSVQVSENLKGKDFAKGTYFVNVFDKGELVSKTSFSLR
jgi:predicted RNase H-like nuclease (RuvC/YqgF family)